MEVMGMMRQVVVVGAGLDTRAFRMPWPRGTAVFELGHRDVHQFAAAALRSVGAKAARGCSHRRVPCDPTLPEAATEADASRGERRPEMDPDLATTAGPDADAGARPDADADVYACTETVAVTSTRPPPAAAYVSGDMEAAMLRAGYAPDVPSIWVLQDVGAMGGGDREHWLAFVEEAGGGFHFACTRFKP